MSKQQKIKKQIKRIARSKNYYGLIGGEDLNANSKNIEKYVKQYKQRGFDDSEIWNLDIEICRFLAPRLAFLRDNHTGFPGQLCKFDDNFNVINEEEAREKWNKILDTMVDGFYLYMSKDEFDLTIDEKKTINKALKYFKKYFTALWD